MEAVKQEPYPTDLQKQRKEQEGTPHKGINKERVKDILDKDRSQDKPYDNIEEDKKYTVEDIIKICKQLNENESELGMENWEQEG